MTYALDEYTGNGAQQNYAVTFPYLATDHVLVTVAGSSAAFTWLNPSTVTITTAPASGAAVRISRDSSRDTPLVDFTNGAALTETDLDTAFLQAVYIAQEAFDASDAVINTQALQDMVDAAELAASESAGSASDAHTDALAAAASALAAAGSATVAYGSAVAADASADAAALSEAAAAGYATSALLKANNLSDLTNAATARTNLGLGSAATTASTAYATAAQGTTADGALQKAVAGTVTVKHTFETAGGAGALGTYLLRELKNAAGNTNGKRWVETLHKNGALDELHIGLLDDAGAWAASMMYLSRSGATPLKIAFNTALDFYCGDTWVAGDADVSGTLSAGIMSASTSISSVKISAQAFYGDLVDAGNLTGSPTVNFNTNGGRFKCVLTGNCTPTYTNPTAPTTLRWYIAQDGTGSRTHAFPTPIKWPASYAAGDKIVSTAAGSLDLWVADWDGTTYHATLLKGYA